MRCLAMIGLVLFLAAIAAASASSKAEDEAEQEKRAFHALVLFVLSVAAEVVYFGWWRFFS